ncbi:MAG: YqgE/AlgH family protein [Cyclobacteriaceae bacterium]|nr:YqgE/AlgH family protein [Cyclobacteriaceae bacterium]
MDFFKYKNRINPSGGRILVSEPYLPDPNFERTIILLCEHNVEGSFGFVLNKPSMANIGDVMEGLADFDAPVLVGGPVQQDTLHYLHRCAEIENAIHVIDNIYWGGDFDNVKFLISTGQLSNSDIKFFLGYSGWSGGQLEAELEEDSWIVSDKFDHNLIFDTTPKEMWKKALEIMGGRFSIYSKYPQDPRMN